MRHYTSIGTKRCVLVDGKEGKQYDGIGVGSLIFSPASKRMAYVATMGNRRFVVVDGKEGNQYEFAGRLSFSHDSGHLVYVVGTGTQRFVVMDGKEEKHYDCIVTLGGGRVIFDSSDGFHYLAQEGSDVYLVEKVR